MINNNHCPTAPTLAPKGHVPNGTGCPIGGGGVNIGVTWFYQQPKIITGSPSLNSLNNNRSSSKSTTENNTVSNRDSIDLIDIEDEDHSFAAFFIGMKTGPSPYVKRPLVCRSALYIEQKNFFHFSAQFLMIFSIQTPLVMFDQGIAIKIF